VDIVLLVGKTILMIRSPTIPAMKQQADTMQHARIMCLQTSYDAVDDLIWTANDYLVVLGTLGRQQQLIEVYCAGVAEETGAPVSQTISSQKAEELFQMSRPAISSPTDSSLVELVQTSVSSEDYFKESCLPASRVLGLETYQYRKCAVSEKRGWVGLTTNDGRHMQILERHVATESECADENEDVEHEQDEDHFIYHEEDSMDHEISHTT